MSYIGLATQREVELVEAAKRLGVTDLTTIKHYWRDGFEGVNRQNIAAALGTCVADTARPGWALASSGATSGGIGGFYLPEMGGNSYGVPGGTSGEWIVSARFIVTTTVDGNTLLSAIAGNGGSGDYILLGVVGSTLIAGGSTTKFAAVCPANVGSGPLLSSVSIDTGVHVARLWRKGGVTSLSVDNETPVTGNTYPTSLTGSGGAYAQSNSNNNRAISVNWQSAAYVRATA